MTDANEPLPSVQRESSNRQEDENEPAPSLPVDLSVSQDVREGPLDSSGDAGTQVSLLTSVSEETSPTNGHPMEVQIPPKEVSAHRSRSRTSDGAHRGAATDVRSVGGGRVNKPIKGGEGTGNSSKGPSKLSSYKQKLKDIPSRIFPPDSKSNK